MDTHVGDYVMSQLKKLVTKIEDPKSSEKILLSCMYQELIVQLIEEAKQYAQRDNTTTISPLHIKEAYETLFSNL